MSPDDLVLLVRQREQDALRRLTAATGTTSLCEDGRSGTSRPGAKYHEGAVSALAEVRRALTATRRSGAPQDGDADVALVHRVRDQWRAESARTTAPVWRTYRTGGVDALDALVEAVGTPEGDAVGR